MTSEFLDRLKLTRSNLPGGASKGGDVAALYRAALQQSEELMVAAEATGPAARPLPLFYALSQAGQAIVVARGTARAIAGTSCFGAPDDGLPRRHSTGPSCSPARAPRRPVGPVKLTP